MDEFQNLLKHQSPQKEQIPKKTIFCKSFYLKINRYEQLDAHSRAVWRAERKEKE